MNQAVAIKPAGALAMQRQDLIRVLGNSLYPGAAAESIELAIAYCEAAGLDPLQKPVHIVPLWDGRAQRMRDVIMPGVNLYRTQAARSGAFAGMSEPEFGPTVSTAIGGQQISYPEWCRVTVKRILPGGVVAEFTAREFWTENYAVKGGKEKSIAPNAMWTKRPFGQLAKCAAAQALRIAFPEIASQPTADEMEGKTIDAHDAAHDVIEAVPPELLAKAKAAARKGSGPYKHFWSVECSREERVILQHEHESLKQVALENDEAAADAAAVAQTAPAQAETGPVGASAEVSEGQGTPADPSAQTTDQWAADMERAEGGDAPADSAPHAKGARGAKRS